MPLNVIYIHSHDTGRYISPYGHECQTPRLQSFAEKGTLFRRAFCAAPTCSPSRAALLTGQAPHSAGMLGLAHRRWSLNDYSQHIVGVLKSIGYETALAGVQHEANQYEKIGYDRRLALSDGPEGQDMKVSRAAAEYLKAPKDRPFFLAVGYNATHRPFPDPACDSPQTDPRFAGLPPCLPDAPQTRYDMAAYNTLVRRLDQCIGKVLDAVADSGLSDSTLIIVTTDHGIAFPFMKCNLTDHGIGVMLMMQGPATLSPRLNDGLVIDTLVSQIDLYPTICEATGAPIPAHCQGLSLWPMLRGEVQSVRDEVFAEVSFHGSYQPMRCVRTERYKYIRRWDLDRYAKPRLANIDPGPSKTFLMEAGLSDRAMAEHELYDLMFDPNEVNNLAGSPDHAAVLVDMQARLDRWMRRTNDPLLNGPIVPHPGVIDCRLDAIDPMDRYIVE